MVDVEKEARLKKKALSFGQQHIFRFWDELNDRQKQQLLNQIETINFDLMVILKEKYLKQSKSSLASSDLEPTDIIPIPTTAQQIARAEQAKLVGEQLLKKGKVGAILVAGGQGTRLGFDGPKGKFSAGPISRKSLFQLHAEKIKAIGQKYQTIIPWFIMTSETNHQETLEFFNDHKHFGLNAADVIFFTQSMIPAIDEQGRFFLDEKHHIFCNPNGHGGTIYALRDNGCLTEMKRRGIEELFYFQVDNVLIKICDPIFLGYHHQAQAEMSSKVVRKTDPEEKVGVIGKINGKLTVIEYSDLPQSAMEARDETGQLKYHSGSIAIHAIRRDFIERLTDRDFSLPYHVAHKAIPYIDEMGNYIEPDSPNGYKFEMFIFDALPYASNSVVMEVARQDEFSPIKDADGKNSPATAEQDLMNYFGRMLQRAGVSVVFDHNNNLSGKLEISSLFALDVAELKQKLPPNFRFDGEMYFAPEQ